MTRRATTGRPIDYGQTVLSNSATLECDAGPERRFGERPKQKFCQAEKSTRRINELTGRALALESLPAGFLRNATYCCRLVQAAPGPRRSAKEEDFDV